MINSNPATGYSEVNVLSMYYEIYGNGNPLVLTDYGIAVRKNAPERDLIVSSMMERYYK